MDRAVARQCDASVGVDQLWPRGAVRRDILNDSRTRPDVARVDHIGEEARAIGRPQHFETGCFGSAIHGRGAGVCEPSLAIEGQLPVGPCRQGADPQIVVLQEHGGLAIRRYPPVRRRVRQTLQARRAGVEPPALVRQLKRRPAPPGADGQLFQRQRLWTHRPRQRLAQRPGQRGMIKCRPVGARRGVHQAELPPSVGQVPAIPEGVRAVDPHRMDRVVSDKRFGEGRLLDPRGPLVARASRHRGRGRVTRGLPARLLGRRRTPRARRRPRSVAPMWRRATPSTTRFTKEELEWLADRVRHLQALVETVCTERLAQLKAQADKAAE